MHELDRARRPGAPAHVVILGLCALSASAQEAPIADPGSLAFARKRIVAARGRLIESRGTSTRSDEGRVGVAAFQTPTASTFVPLCTSGSADVRSTSGS